MSLWKVVGIASVSLLLGFVAGFMISHTVTSKAILSLVEYDVYEREREAAEAFLEPSHKVRIYAQRSLINDLSRRNSIGWIDDYTHSNIVGMAYARMGASYHVEGMESEASEFLGKATLKLADAGIEISENELLSGLLEFRRRQGVKSGRVSND